MGLGRWRARVRSLRSRPQLDRELDLELQAWIDELAERFEADGLPPAEARRRARLATEGVEQVKDRVRDVRPGWIGGLFGAAADRVRFDLVTALRSLKATPVVTLAAIATLAAATGVNLAMAGLVQRALISPPAHLTQPSRLFTAVFHGGDERQDAIRMSTSFLTLTQMRDHVPALAGVAGFQPATPTLVIDGDQRKVAAMLVTGNYFAVLGASPRLGAGLSPRQDRAGPDADVIVISDALWRLAFAADPSVIGRRAGIRGRTYTVAGVMPAGFSGHSSAAVDVWIPLASVMQDVPDWDRNPYRNVASILVRLKDDQPLAAAEGQAASATGMRTTFSRIAGAGVAATHARIAWWLSGVSVLVLLIGLANAGTLLVVRAARRRRDMDIRRALGASRARLLAQSAIEALLLAAAAMTMAVVVSGWFDELIRRVLFPGLVAAGAIGASTMAAAVVAGAVMFVVAAIANRAQFRSPDVGSTGSRAAVAASSGARPRMVRALLFVQTSVSVVLLAGAVMFGRSLYNLMRQDLGLRMDGVVVVEFEPGPDAGAVDGARFVDAIDRVRALPGVELVSPIASVPFGGFNVPPISVPGHPEPPSVGGQLPSLIAATPELLQILDIRVLEGRPLTPADMTGPPVVLINQAMARALWPGASALGKCIRIGFDPDFDPSTSMGPPTPSDNVVCRQIVGVTRDVRQRSLVPSGNEAALMQYYVPITQVPLPPFAQRESPVWGLALRATADAATLAPAVRRIIVGSDPGLPFLRVVPYASLLDRQKRPWALGASLLTLFSGLALAVAGIGLYASFAHAVGERRKEMAIRLAIGARPVALFAMVLSESLVIASIGAAAGCAAALASSRFVQALLFETAPSDPTVLASASGLMLFVAVLASWLPARSAAQSDPNLLLRV